MCCHNHRHVFLRFVFTETCSSVYIILYENPSTQDEIAERLGITRRYVNQLLQPLVKEGIIRRAYTIDFKSYESIAQSLSDYSAPKNTKGNVIVNDMLANMARHVHSQLEASFDSVLEYDEEKAKKALEMDFATNIKNTGIVKIGFNKYLIEGFKRGIPLTDAMLIKKNTMLTKIKQNPIE